MENIFIKIIASYYLEDYGMPALICEGGLVFLMLTSNRYYSKKEFLEDPGFNQMGKEYKRTRLKLYEDLLVHHNKNNPAG